MTDVTLGASDLWLAIRTGAGGTATLAYSLYGWAHGSMNSRFSNDDDDDEDDDGYDDDDNYYYDYYDYDYYYILIFKFLEGSREENSFWTE